MVDSIIFNKIVIRSIIEYKNNYYIRLLYRNEIETRETNVNQDNIEFYKIPKNETKISNYNPKAKHLISHEEFKLVENNDIYLRH